MAKPVWRDELYVTVYELARGGMRKNRILKAIKVTPATFYKWWKRKPALRDAYMRGRGKRKGLETYRQYVYNRLPAKLKKVWDDINACETKKNGIERAQAILKDAGKKARQHLFLYAYTTCGFNASEACRCLCMARQVYEGWYRDDPEFHDLFDEMEKHKKDYFEGALIDLVSARDPSAVIFVNKTYNADRGYGAKLEVKHSGNIQHQIQHVPIKDLNLENDLKKALLQAIRERNDKLVKLEHKSNGHAIAT